MASAVTADMVRVHAGWATALEGQDAQHLDAVVSAVNAMLPQICPRLREKGVTDWPADVLEAATMLAHRLWTRRASPTGVTAFTDAGPSYVGRYDPDIERLLQVGAWLRPQFL